MSEAPVFTGIPKTFGAIPLVLITGASGFVGRNVLRKCVARGMRVRCFVRRVPESNDAIRGGQVEWVAGSIQDKSSLIKAFEGVDKVVHLVGIIAPSGSNTFEGVHAAGTHNVVEAAKQAGVKKIVHMSALGTHAHAESHYHQTKWKAEVYVRYSGTPYTIFRPSIVFGPGDKFLNMFAGMMRWSPIVPLVGGGTNRLQPIWVEDVAECFVRALDNTASDGKLYELGGPHDYSMRDLMQVLMKVTGRKRMLLSIPLPIMQVQAALMQMVLPMSPITLDQLRMLKSNNTCDESPAVKDFGIKLAELIPTLKTYIVSSRGPEGAVAIL